MGWSWPCCRHGAVRATLHLWKAQAAGGSNVIAIINPNSGPHFSSIRYDATPKCLPHLQKAGVKSIGYVATGYGKRPLADIQRDIKRYQQAYRPLQGLFFDEGINWCAVLLTRSMLPAKLHTTCTGLRSGALKITFYRQCEHVWQATCIRADGAGGRAPTPASHVIEASRPSPLPGASNFWS